jgi:hypothetical protein
MAKELIKMSADQAKIVDAFLKGDKNFQSAGFGSQLIQVGFKGILEQIALAPVAGAGTFPRSTTQGPQKINGITVAEVDEPSVTLSLVFEGGRTLSLSTLTQHPDSNIDGKKCSEMVGKDWQKLIGKLLTCTASDPDTEKTIVRVRSDADGKTTRENANPRNYKFTATAAK